MTNALTMDEAEVAADVLYNLSSNTTAQGEQSPASQVFLFEQFFVEWLNSVVMASILCLDSSETRTHVEFDRGVSWFDYRIRCMDNLLFKNAG